MAYELHITCDTNDFEAFNKFCIESKDEFPEILCSKGIYIQLPEGSKNPKQIMTAIRFNSDDFKKTIKDIARHFETHEFNPVRVKVEQHINSANEGCYLEWHYKIPSDATVNNDLLKQLNLHWSKSLMKKNGEVNRLLTLRDYDVSNKDLGTKVYEELKKEIPDIRSYYEKEICVYDSNINLDDGWL